MQIKTSGLKENEETHIHPEELESDDDWDDYSEKKNYFFAVFTAIAIICIFSTLLGASGHWLEGDGEALNRKYPSSSSSSLGSNTTTATTNTSNNNNNTGDKVSSNNDTGTAATTALAVGTAFYNVSKYFYARFKYPTLPRTIIVNASSSNISIVNGTATGNETMVIAASAVVSTRYSLWGLCFCVNVADDEPCSSLRDLFRWSQGLSGAGCGTELLVTFLLVFAHSGYPGKKKRLVLACATVFSAISVLLIVCSVATFGVSYSHSFCGANLVKQRGGLYWSYGLRVVEILMTALFFLGLLAHTLYAMRRLMRTLSYISLLLTLIDVISTSNNLWVYDPRGLTLGVWEMCVCDTLKDVALSGLVDDTNKEDYGASYYEQKKSCGGGESAMLQASAAFIIFAILSALIFLLTFFLRISKRAQLPIAIVATLFLATVLILFLIWSYTAFCGGEDLSVRAAGFTYGWPFFLCVIELVVSVGVCVSITCRCAMKRHS